MYTEDSLAAAQIAKIFGSELLGVQEKTRTDSGSQPQILKIHPKQFLGVTSQHQAQIKEQEKIMLQQLQREAEMQYPLPNNSQEVPLEANVQPTEKENVSIQLTPKNTSSTVSVNVETSNVWEKININLERIANSLEQVEVSIKKKRIKRNKTSTLR